MIVFEFVLLKIKRLIIILFIQFTLKKNNSSTVSGDINFISKLD